MSELDVHWLAGLLEGEGFFGTITSRVAGKAYRYPRIGVSMTDRDVIARVGAMWSIKVFCGQPSGKTLSILPFFRVMIIGKGAAEWMKTLRPLMGARRQAQIDKALQEWHSRPTASVMRQATMRLVATRKQRSADGRFVS